MSFSTFKVSEAQTHASPFDCSVLVTRISDITALRLKVPVEKVVTCKRAFFKGKKTASE